MREAGVFAAQWAILARTDIPHMFWTNNDSLCPNLSISIWQQYHNEKQGFGYPVAFEKIPGTPTKSRWSRAEFQKVQPTPCKTTYDSPHSHLGVQNSNQHEN